MARLLIALVVVACFQVSDCFLAPVTGLVSPVTTLGAAQSQVPRRRELVLGSLQMSAASGASERGSNVGRLARWRSAVVRAAVTAARPCSPPRT